MGTIASFKAVAKKKKSLRLSEMKLWPSITKRRLYTDNAILG
jgi:hypothetical protein